MNQEDYLRNAIEDARGTFLVTYIDYQRGLEGRIEDAPTYGSVLGAVRVYERLSRDESEEIWEDAKRLVDYLIKSDLF
jgi:hypothetical protein